MTPQLRPMGLSDIFDEGFDLYRRNFAFLLLVAALVAVPLHVISAYISVRFLHGFLGLTSAFNSSGGAPDPSQLFDWLGSLTAATFGFVLVSGVMYALEMVVLARAASAAYLNETLTLWDVYRLPLKRIGSLAITGLLYSVFVTLGFFLCYVGILWPVTILAFTAHTFIVEGKSYFKALGRSKTLSRGEGGRILGTLFVLGALSTVFSLGISYPLNYLLETLLNLTPGASGVLSGSLGPGVSLREQVLLQISSGIASLITTPFLLSVVTVMYYDIRVRHEAYDIELAARGLGYPPLETLTAYPPLAMPQFPMVGAPVKKGRGRRAA